MFVTNLNPIMKKALLALSFVLCATIAMAQYQNKDGNRIGITGGVSQTSLLNSNFVTTPGIGFNGGLSVRGNYYNNWSMIYGMQFFQNTFSIETTTSTLQKKESEFNIQGAQIRLLLSYNVVKNHVSLDFGPVLQINDKLKTADSDQNNTITGTNLKAVQLEEISKVNGVIQFQTSYVNANSTVKFDNTKTSIDSIAAAINSTGYKVVSQPVKNN